MSVDLLTYIFTILSNCGPHLVKYCWLYSWGSSSVPVLEKMKLLGLLTAGGCGRLYLSFVPDESRTELSDPAVLPAPS